MEAYFDASITASILLQEVMKELKINKSPEKCCKDGLDKKIFRKCKKIIEKKYSNKDYQDLLKLYISSYFIDDSIKDDGTVYEEMDNQEIYSEFEEDLDEIFN